MPTGLSKPCRRVEQIQTSWFIIQYHFIFVYMYAFMHVYIYMYVYMYVYIYTDVCIYALVVLQFELKASHLLGR
jgi:hypothetical protein